MKGDFRLAIRNGFQTGTVGHDAIHHPQFTKMGQAPIVVIGASPIFMADTLVDSLCSLSLPRWTESHSAF